MRRRVAWAACCLAVILAAPSASAARPVAVVAPSSWVAVLVAGDGSLPVFDNAVDGMVGDLRRSRNPDLTRSADADPVLLSARRPHAVPATRAHVLAAVAAMRPGPGEGCLVFATSHGVRGQGLYLSLLDEVLSPRALDRALLQGCGAAPTVVIVSSCFSGSFAQPPMTRDNRVVITAARPDRTSFGCQAGREYTVFDACLLAALDRSGTWPQAYGVTRACVAAEERREGVTPSEPQAWFGPAVARLAVHLP